MAEERDEQQRTEEPTQRRLEDARKKGDVVKSQELAFFVLLSGGTLALVLTAGSAAKAFLSRFLFFLSRPDEIALSSASATDLMQRVVFGLFAILGPAAGLIVAAALGGHLLQHRPIFSADKLKPDLSKLSLLKGAKRLFGLDGIVNVLKGILKISAVGIAAFLTVWPDRARLEETMSLQPSALAGMAIALTAKVLLASLVVLGAISALDYMYQRQRFMSRQRMTRQELKDEVKQGEGDPQIKARIRQLRYDRSRKRMMAKVPEATVVIMNPTHYAVALKYESGKMAAPVCVAKGMDAVALRIRAVAEEHDVPIVENPPLARALYATVELDQEIPPDQYKAVAHIIGYVMRIANQKAFWKN